MAGLEADPSGTVGKGSDAVREISTLSSPILKGSVATGQSGEHTVDDSTAEVADRFSETTAGADAVAAIVATKAWFSATGGTVAPYTAAVSSPRGGNLFFGNFDVPKRTARGGEPRIAVASLVCSSSPSIADALGALLCIGEPGAEAAMVGEAVEAGACEPP